MNETPSLELEQVLPPELLSYLEEEQKRLIRDSLLLVEYFKKCEDLPSEIHDFAFVVFPLAKAYEGFLKTYFYRIGLISEQMYAGRHFRVGRSFNPDLPEKYRDEFWLYDNVARECGDELARVMWDVWLDARNHLFHYFPHDKYDLTLEESSLLVTHAVEVMGEAVRCAQKAH